MEARLNYAKVAPAAYKAMLGLEAYLHQCGLEEPLLHLIKLRSSQINGCRRKQPRIRDAMNNTYTMIAYWLIDIYLFPLCYSAQFTHHHAQDFAG